MSGNADERDVARRMGFGRPRPPLPLPLGGGPLGASKTLLEILGVRSGLKAAFVGVRDPHLRAAGSSSALRTASVPPRPVDVIVYQVDNAFALRRIGDLVPLVKHGGALWVLWPQDQSHIKEGHVQRSGLAAGMIDVANVGVSERLSGMKFIHGQQGRKGR